jgi:hypothetical protein
MQTIEQDISGIENIQERYDKCEYNKWVKLLPINKTILFDKYDQNECFVHVADIVLDNEIYVDGKKKGEKKRKTVIQFLPTINADDFKAKNEWLYLLVVNNRIVKIGGTRVGLKGRVDSYLCGHHIQERGKSGDCSKTNAFIYNTLDFYLQLGCNIKMYGYKLPKTEFEVTIINKTKKVVAQTYHAYESTFLEEYKRSYHSYPLLSDNCDPDYKDD